MFTKGPLVCCATNANKSLQGFAILEDVSRLMIHAARILQLQQLLKRHLSGDRQKVGSRYVWILESGVCGMLGWAWGPKEGTIYE